MTLRPPPNRHLRLLGTLASVVLLLDQASKAVVRSRLAVGERVALWPPVLDFVRVENSGMTWGLLSGHPLRLPFVTFLSLATLLLLASWYRHLLAGERRLAWSIALILSGAAGNFVDRLLYRRVTDFVQLSLPGPPGALAERLFGTRSWAVFNVADVAIVAGLALFLWLALRAEAVPPMLRSAPQESR